MSSRRRESIERRETQKRIDEKKKRLDEIAALRTKITDRLRHVPKTWVERYKEKLSAHGLNPATDVNQIDNLDHLYTRHQLLPPATTYQHYTKKAHPSLPEARATQCRNMARHTREYVSNHCDNSEIISLTTGMPVSIKRFAPRNIDSYTVHGRHECLSKALLKHLHKNDYTLAQSYQRDGHNDNWPEMLSTPAASSPFRIPYHVAETCGTHFKIPPPHRRRQPPSNSTY